MPPLFISPGSGQHHPRPGSSHSVCVASIPPGRSYSLVSPVYPERVNHCNSILKDLLQVEKGISYFIRDGIHFNGYGTYKMYRAVRGAVCFGLDVMDRLRGGKPAWHD